MSFDVGPVERWQIYEPNTDDTKKLCKEIEKETGKRIVASPEETWDAIATAARGVSALANRYDQPRSEIERSTKRIRAAAAKLRGLLTTRDNPAVSEIGGSWWLSKEQGTRPRRTMGELIPLLVLLEKHASDAMNKPEKDDQIVSQLIIKYFFPAYETLFGLEPTDDPFIRFVSYMVNESPFATVDERRAFDECSHLKDTTIKTAFEIGRGWRNGKSRKKNQEVP